MSANPAQAIASREAVGEAEPSLRDVARMNIHGERWRDLGELLDRLQKDHKIDDRVGLENAVDAAVLIYHHRPKSVDLKRLKLLPEGVKVFLDEDVMAIAHILIDRDRSLLANEAWDRDAAVDAWTRVLMIRKLLLSDPRIRKFFSDLERALRRQPLTRKPDMRLQGMVASLRRYWQGLGRKATCTFTKKDQKTKRQLPASEFAKFLDSITWFIDPNAAPKLPSATRHRLR